MYAPSAAAPAVVNTVQLPARVEWQLSDRVFEVDEDVSNDALRPIQGAHVEAAKDLPAPVARAAAQLAWRERVDAVYVVRYQVSASSADDFQTPPGNWKVHLVAREMKLAQDYTQDEPTTQASGDQGVDVADEAGSRPPSRPKREPRPLSLVGVGLGLDSDLDVFADLSVGRKGLRGHVGGAYDLSSGKSVTQVRAEGGAGYALRFARSWVEVEPALFVAVSYSSYSKSWYNGQGLRYAPVTVYAEPALLARWYPTKTLSIDFGNSVTVPVIGVFRDVGFRTRLGVGLHF